MIRWLGRFLCVFFVVGAVAGVWLASPGAPAAFRISHELEIDASSRQVWNVLIAIDDYPSWNAYIPKMTGELNEGSVITMTLVEPPHYRSREYHATVLKVIPDQQVVWSGSLLGMGIFEHHVEVLGVGEDRAKLIQYEDFKGLLCWLVRISAPGMMASSTASVEASFRSMNEALRQRVYMQDASA